MDNALLPSRRRHVRSTTTIVDARSVQRSESCPIYNGPSTHRTPSIWTSKPFAETPGASSSSTRNTASRIVSTMRRPFSTTPRKRDASAMGMYSTPEESNLPAPSPYNVRDIPLPTIQQIAMGLHVSRTPHLRPPHLAQPSHARSRSRGHSDDTLPPFAAPLMKASSDNRHRRRGSASAIMLPPPPARSSLKKPSTPTPPRSAPPSLPLTPSGSDLSLTGSTLTSSAPVTPRSMRTASVTLLPARLQLSVSRLLRSPSRKNSTASSTTSGKSGSESVSSELTPRKMVRFTVSSQEGELDVADPAPPQ
ncbi:uncharacterized protein FIBRA_08433 [Fibroporia radiculosa]|uniref:Uncharacterized protein n=1 Tax=Fibroporia radiculosa TaxID=599839 RepID=J4ICC9_9APHY|nr:uncharacterized protein FIBRA_08433 [Fibroporia radiculosa]CCM06191.1 predicted protein [Fibroporia radiculosa]